MKKRSHAINTVWTVVLTVLSVAWVYPVVMVLINSFKKDSAISTNTAFQLPTAEAAAYCARAGWSAGAAVLLGRAKRAKKSYSFDDL